MLLHYPKRASSYRSTQDMRFERAQYILSIIRYHPRFKADLTTVIVAGQSFDLPGSRAVFLLLLNIQSHKLQGCCAAEAPSSKVDQSFQHFGIARDTSMVVSVATTCIGVVVDCHGDALP